jgi:uncharacterized protein (TIGR00730 family)
MKIQRVCVYCGSSSGARTEYADAASAFGTLLAQRGLELVYGGGRCGLMGILADAVLNAGAKVIGVIPQDLVAREVAHAGLTDLRVVASMHERKAVMAGLADAFIALPGGVGTFEEFFEVITWAQLGLHEKPVGLLNLAGYYDSLLALLDHGVAERFIRPEHRGMILSDTDSGRLFAKLAEAQPVRVAKWID